MPRMSGRNGLMRREGYLSCAEAAARLGLHPATIRRLAAQGRLGPPRRLGCYWYIARVELERHFGPDSARLLGRVNPATPL